MKQTASIISTYSADVFGVCSALFELGGMIVMHDASGCNSTYTTHDEPRWMDMDAMVYISAISEMEAIMGDDAKLVSDIADAARALHPRFIAVAGTPIPAMTGFDYAACAALIEQETGIPALGITTTGMDSYILGASRAYATFCERFVRRDVKKTATPSVNIVGMTPLDFSIMGEAESVAAFCARAGFAVNANFSMGCAFEDIANAGAAHVSLVVSAAGLAAARWMQAELGIPYVIGTPVAGAYGDALADRLAQAARGGDGGLCAANAGGGDIAIVGENVRSIALAEAITRETGRACRVISSLDESILRPGDAFAPWEDDVRLALHGTKAVIADPMFAPIAPAGARFIRNPHEACSGRLYRGEIIDPARGIDVLLSQL